MGVVSLEEALKHAERHGYAVGMFNVFDDHTMGSVLQAAETERSPVILSLPEVDWGFIDYETLIPAMARKAREATVPVVLHYDHGHNTTMMQRLLDHGWSSLMIDASMFPFAENVRKTVEVVTLSSGYGASVEAELGHVPGNETEEDGEAAGPELSYTRVEEAECFVEETGVHALAVAVGTVHGVYKQPPRLNIELLKELHSAVPVPLVLHGGSGLSKEEFQLCILNGIRKVNVFTGIMNAAGTVAAQQDGPASLPYHQLIPLMKKKMQDTVAQNMRIFSSSGKAGQEWSTIPK